MSLPRSTKIKIFFIVAILTISFSLEGSVSAISDLNQKIPPYTSVAGIDISYKNLESAQDLLTEKINKFLNTALKIRLGKEIYQFIPAELGINFYVSKTLEDIPLIGENTDFVEFLQQFVKTKELKLKYTFDKEKARTVLIDNIPSLKKTKGHNAIFEIDKKGNITIIPEKEGIEPDIEKLKKDIEEITKTLQPTEIVLKTKKTYPTITKKDLEKRQEKITKKLNQNITLKYEGLRFNFLPKNHANFISFKEKQIIAIPNSKLEIPVEFSDKYPYSPINPTQKKINIHFDKDKLIQFIQSNIAKDIEVTPQNVKISKEENGYSFDGTAKNGKEINKRLLAEMIELATNNDIQILEIPTEKISGKVEANEELVKLGIEELIAVGYSTFYGSPKNRIHNIHVGMARFNGLLLAPGATFSFNGNLGRVDGTTGYKRELTIVGTDTIPEYGGGLCQVSSTFFRAILWGGLPIVERAPHSYAVSYYAHPYGYGLDATIYPGSHDVQFLNDTGQHILIQSYAIGEEAYFKFYGTSDGREIIMDGPYISSKVSPPPDIIIYTEDLEPGETVMKDRSHAGFDATWYRTIKYLNGESKEETIYSHYKAWPAKYLKGKEPEEQPEEQAEATEPLEQNEPGL